MIDHEDSADLATVFEQRFGTLALDIASLDQLPQRDTFPILITGFPDIEALGNFDRQLAIVTAEISDRAIAESIDSGRGENFDQIRDFFADYQVVPFVVIKERGEQPSGQGPYEVTKYLAGLKVTNDSSKSLHLTSSRRLVYYPGDIFSPKPGAWQIRPGLDSILHGLAK